MAAWTCPECWDPTLCMHGTVNDTRYLPDELMLAAAGWVEVTSGVWLPPSQAGKETGA